MSLTQSILSSLQGIDEVLGPSGLDILPTSVSIVTRTWNEGRRGAGGADNYTEQALCLPQGITVRHLATREIAGSGGRFEQGDMLVGPIRPPFTDPVSGATGGFTEAQIKPPGQQGVEIIWRLTSTQPNGSGINGDYALIEFRRDHPFFYEAVIGRKRSTP